MACAIVIVTHNSEAYINKNLACLMKQTQPADKIIIVDSGSRDPTYLRKLPKVHVIMAGKDVGFCKGNNIGIAHVDSSIPYVLFLNPDAFLTPNFLAPAIETMNRSENKDIGILTGPMLGYDILADRPNGRYDSTGIFRSWYGRFYDRDQGKPITSVSRPLPECVPAICGALMFCRMAALRQVQLSDNEVFNNTFFMYKEDIDLSLRLRDKGWRLLLDPQLVAYHCRGWNPDRSKVPRALRLMSAKNDLKINVRRKSPYAAYSLILYLAVGLFDA